MTDGFFDHLEQTLAADFRAAADAEFAIADQKVQAAEFDCLVTSQALIEARAARNGYDEDAATLAFCDSALRLVDARLARVKARSARIDTVYPSQ